MRLQRVLLLVSFGLVLSHCCTDQAAKVRADRRITVGLAGLSVRPTANNAIAATFDYLPSGTTVKHSDETTHDIALRPDYGHSGGVAWLHFPWESSAFFWGVGFDDHRTIVKFDAAAANANNAPVAVSYLEERQAIGIPLGWYWIYENGFTFALDFGPRWRSNYWFTALDDGGTAVNSTDRNSTAGAYRDLNDHVAVSFSGQGIIGYSF